MISPSHSQSTLGDESHSQSTLGDESHSQKNMGREDQPTMPDMSSTQIDLEKTSGGKSPADSERSSFDENKSNSEPGPPPDGGLTAWLQVFLMFLVFFNTWGVSNGYGIFQDYYSQNLPESYSTIAWIGDVQVFFLFSVGAISGRLTDEGHFKITFGIGVFLQLLGLFMTSLCKSYWQIMLAQGVCLGLGNGFTFCPALTVMSPYFKKNRSMAVGLASSGGAVGGLVYPAMLNTLLSSDKMGFPWSIRIMAFVMLAAHIPCLIWFKPRLPARESGPWIDTSAFKELTFIFFSLSMFLSFWGLYFTFFYMGTFARDVIGYKHPISLILILNGVGVIGRSLAPTLADKYTGAMNLAIPVGLASSILLYCMPAVTTTAGLYAFAVIYGLMAAATQALLPAISTTMSPDLSRTGTRMGMILTFTSIANLTGPAICGAIINSMDGSYLGAAMFAASVVFVGTIFSLAARISRGGTGLWVKV